jgi:hypothetical protein
MVRILEVQQIRYSFLKSMPPKLMIEARGIVSSMGWSDIKLVSMEKKLSDDGILDLEFVGKPPKDIVGQVITEVMASILIEDDVEKIHGILVHARTNKSLQMIGEATGSLSADFELQKYEHMTTMAIGEEDKFPPITIFEFGEEGKSPIWGGEGKSPLKVKRVSHHIRVKRAKVRLWVRREKLFILAKRVNPHSWVKRASHLSLAKREKHLIWVRKVKLFLWARKENLRI